MTVNNRDRQVEIQVNGKPRLAPAGSTVLDLLGELNLHEKLVVVEHNGTILKRGTFSSVSLAEGDVIEIAHFVGGG